jgi:type IV secretory pathway VirB2 component (pilin)
MKKIAPLVLLYLASSSAFAQSPVAALKSYIQPTYEESQMLAISLAALLIIALAITAFFGKFSWKWFFSLVCSLGLIAGVASYVAFVKSSGTDAQLATQATKVIDDSGENLSAIAYGIAGLGILVTGIMAFFGQFKWVWFWSGVGGMMLIAGFDNLHNYIGAWGNAADQVKPVKNMVGDVQGNAEMLAYGIAAIGIFGTGILMFFGDFPKKWFFAIVAGLIVIAAANMLTQYVTGQQASIPVN